MPFGDVGGVRSYYEGACHLVEVRFETKTQDTTLNTAFTVNIKPSLLLTQRAYGSCRSVCLVNVSVEQPLSPMTVLITLWACCPYGGACIWAEWRRDLGGQGFLLQAGQPEKGSELSRQERVRER